jgi:hypothetical protein
MIFTPPISREAAEKRKEILAGFSTGEIPSARLE